METLRVRYRWALPAGADARESAGALAREQTVEVPADCVPPEFEATVVPPITACAVDGSGTLEVELAYSRASAGRTVGQLLNLICGNASMFPGCRVEAVTWPDWVRGIARGPRQGLAGWREQAGEAGRPLLMASIKPLGHDARELARRCREIVAGGFDLVKDDHSLADQVWAPFEERTRRCAAAVAEAAADSGRRALYIPHLDGRFEDLPPRLEFLAGLGCRAVLVHPALLGWDSLRWLAADGRLLVLAHPTFSGGLWNAAGGNWAPAVLLGDVLRLLGADGVVFPLPGTRLAMLAGEETAVVESLRRPWDGVVPALPVLGGGIDATTLAPAARRWGDDVAYLVGSTLYAGGPDLRSTAARLRAVLEGAVPAPQPAPPDLRS